MCNVDDLENSFGNDVYCRSIKSVIYSANFTLDLHMASFLFDMPFAGQITARIAAWTMWMILKIALIRMSTAEV